MDNATVTPNDLAADRLLLAQKMMVIAHEALDQLDAPYLVYNFGGRDNSYEEHLLDSAPMEVRHAAMRLAAIAFDRATKVLEKTSDGLVSAHSLLDSLASGFARAAAEYEGAHDDSPDDGIE